MKAGAGLLAPLVCAAFGFWLGRGPATPSALKAPANLSTGAFEAGSAQAAGAPTGDSLAPIFGRLLGRTSLRDFAEICSQLERLDASQFASLLDRIERLNDPHQKAWMRRLLAYWTKRDIAAATAWIMPRIDSAMAAKGSAASFARFGFENIVTWAQNAPESALEYARQYPGSILSRELLRAAILSWPEESFARRLEVLQQFPAGKDRQGVMVALASTWWYKDNFAALSAMGNLPAGPERDEALGSILIHQATLFSFASTLDAAEKVNLENPDILAAMAKRGAQQDPAGAARLIEERNLLSIQPVRAAVAQTWAAREPAAALDWALAHDVSLLDNLTIQGSTLDSPFQTALKKNREATLAWVNALPPGPQRDQLLAHAVKK